MNQFARLRDRERKHRVRHGIGLGTGVRRGVTFQSVANGTRRRKHLPCLVKLLDEGFRVFCPLVVDDNSSTACLLSLHRGSEERLRLSRLFTLPAWTGLVVAGFSRSIN